VAQVLHSGSAEGTFAPFDCQPMFPESLQNCADMLQVRALGIEEDQDEDSNEILQHVIYKSLERRRRIG
jgi:hypothetical protein